MADTKRPTSPAAEEILGGYFPVLDHGFVSLVDYMGTDEDIERAARVSYGYGTRKVSATRGLIRYLRRHAHTTPSEMVEFKFHCAMPIFVARQWIRHRTACLAAGTQVYFDLPGGIDRRGNQLHKLSIEELWTRFQRDRIRSMHLRQVNEDTLDIQHTRLVDVTYSGSKPVFRMTLSDGKQIEATSNHRFLFPDGWKTLHTATGLDVRKGRACWDAGDHYVYANGVVAEEPALYREKSWLRDQYHVLGRPIADIASDAGVSCHTIRKWLRVHDLWREAHPRARTGSASNFWRGGLSSDREAIGRWTTQIAPEIHARNGWTCQLCLERASEIHCHHIVPVWANEDLARDEANLTTLCGTCHRSIQGRELEVAKRLSTRPIITKRDARTRVAWNKLTKATLVRIESFEYLGLKDTYDLEVEGPFHNFVADGIITHNSVNEYSGRYSLMPLLFYEPPASSFALQSRTNNQGRETEPAPPELYAEAIARWERVREQASDTYGWLVLEDVARELARIDLPLSTYTQWYWKIDLHNLLHFLRLRVDAHAQWEIQEYGRVMAGMLARVAPLSYEAWLDYEVMGERITDADRRALHHLLVAEGDTVAARPGTSPLGTDALKDMGMSAREVTEFLAKLEPLERPDFSLDVSQMRSAEEMAERLEAAVPERSV